VKHQLGNYEFSVKTRGSGANGRRTAGVKTSSGTCKEAQVAFASAPEKTG